METSLEVQDKIIIGTFTGDVHLQDIIDSWGEIFSRYDDLREFKGILSDFLNANLHHEDDNLNVMTEFLKGYVDRMEGMKMAMVMDTPMVTYIIMLDRRLKKVQIRPFATRKGALDWISL